MSACALALALAQPFARAAAEAPAASKVFNSVQLQGLRILPGQIAENAVGVDQLVDGAVVGSKLADGAVTQQALSNEAMIAIARLVSRSESVVGEVDESGSVVRGERFTAERTGAGEYKLTFAEPFIVPPVVVAVAQSYVRKRLRTCPSVRLCY